MAETATMPPDQAEPPERKDRRGCPPGKGTVAIQPEAPNGAQRMGHIGNPPFEPTNEQIRDVEAWVRAGLTEQDIAILLDVHKTTVRKYFSRQLEVGRAKLKVALGGKAVKMALEGDRTMLIFWLRTQAKWNVRVEHTGADGGPIRTYDLSAFGADDKRLLVGLIDQMLGQHGGEEADGDSAGTAEPTTH